MNRVYQELKKVGVFYISTMDGDQPRVRPFGGLALFEDKCYILMNNQKKVFQQVMKNPKIEITALYPREGECWMRLEGVVVHDERREAKHAMLEQNPHLRQMYSEDDGLLEVFYLDNVRCTKYSFYKEPEIIQFRK